MDDLSLHLLDICENSIRAEASLIEIAMQNNLDNHELVIIVKDNGHGMSEEILKQVTNPFYTSRTTRKIGLGIPLFKQTLEQTGGYLKITSTRDVGTTIEAMMRMDSIDSIPLGNITETLYLLMINPENTELRFTYQFISSPKPDFILDTRDIKSVLAGVSMQEYSVMCWLKEYITNGIRGE